MTETTTSKGLKVGCIRCGEVGTVWQHTADVEVFRCTDCDEEYTRADVEAAIESAKRWTRLLAWIDQAPTED